MIVAGLRGHFNDANWHGIPAQWQRLLSHGRIPGQTGVVYYGLCFNTAGGFDYFCGAEVSEAAVLGSEFARVSLPAQRYAIFAHHEHVSKIRETCEAIWRQWFPASGHELARPADGAPDFFERYGEGFDPKTGTGDIEVWIPIQ
jgi:AraC family transcriptional regulator